MYAEHLSEGLSKYEHKGKVGLPEVFDSEADVDRKCEKLAKLIQKARYVVVHTGAGISTSAGIPDFRGPKGVWTLESKGEKPKLNVSFAEAVPTKTHMALKALVDAGHVQYIVSQNIDGLHMRSGIERNQLSELHGNIYVEQCNKCKRQFVRGAPAPTVGQKPIGDPCSAERDYRPCRGGVLLDTVLDWQQNLPDSDLDMAIMHSSLADLNICLGSTLQIVPSGNLPLKNKKYGGKLAICNLQPTKHNSKADVVISTYVDTVMEKVLDLMNIPMPQYSLEKDITKKTDCEFEWTIESAQINEMKKQHATKIKRFNEQKKRRNSSDVDKDFKCYYIKRKLVREQAELLNTDDD